MTALAQQLFDQALVLDEHERLALASGLLASVPPPHEAGERSGDEWIVEIERRARAALNGSPSLTWAEARATLDPEREGH